MLMWWSLQKIPELGGSDSFQAGEYIYALGGDAPQMHEDRGFCAWDPSRPLPMYLSIWLFTCVL